MLHNVSMMFLSILPLVWFALQARPQVPTSNAVVADSASAACDLLKNHVAELHLATKKPDRYWFCDFATTQNEYVRIIGLRSSAPRSDGATIYSNLLGWYAVARRSRLVLELEVGENRLVSERVAHEPSVRNAYELIEDSQEAACSALKMVVADIRSNGQPDPSWTCDFSPKKDEYLYIVSLRSSATLIGKFAVAKGSGLVLGFDDARNRLIPLQLSQRKQ